MTPDKMDELLLKQTLAVFQTRVQHGSTGMLQDFMKVLIFFHFIARKVFIEITHITKYPFKQLLDTIF